MRMSPFPSCSFAVLSIRLCVTNLLTHAAHPRSQQTLMVTLILCVVLCVKLRLPQIKNNGLGVFGLLLLCTLHRIGCRFRSESDTSKTTYNQRQERMANRLNIINRRYQELERRRALEVEGFQNDLRSLRQKLRKLESQLYKVRLMTLNSCFASLKDL